VNAFGWAALATLGTYTAFSFWLHWKTGRQTRDLLDQRVVDAKHIARLYYDAQMAEVGLSDLMTRLKRISADHERAKDQGEKAAVAAMNILAKERDEFLASLQAWILIANAALLLGAKPTGALKAAPKPPLALPSYGFLVEPDLLLPADDADAGFTYWAAVESEPLPAGTNGTRP
jgi:hypothetical protein